MLASFTKFLLKYTKLVDSTTIKSEFSSRCLVLDPNQSYLYEPWGGAVIYGMPSKRPKRLKNREVWPRGEYLTPVASVLPKRNTESWSASADSPDHGPISLCGMARIQWFVECLQADGVDVEGLGLVVALTVLFV